MNITLLKNQVHLKKLTVELNGTRLNMIVDSVTPYKLTLVIDGKHYVDEYTYPQGQDQIINKTVHYQPAHIEIILDAELTRQHTLYQSVTKIISHRIIHCKATNENYMQYVNTIHSKSQECVICLTNQPSELLDCGHVCFCKTCLAHSCNFCQQNCKVFQCPICRKVTQSSISLETKLLTNLDQLDHSN